jgi:hypothetical protein
MREAAYNKQAQQERKGKESTKELQESVLGIAALPGIIYLQIGSNCSLTQCLLLHALIPRQTLRQSLEPLARIVAVCNCCQRYHMSEHTSLCLRVSEWRDIILGNGHLELSSIT